MRCKLPLVFFSILMTSNYAHAQLLAFFPFDNGSLDDASGNNVLATNMGAVATNEGHHGWAFRFDGDDGIRIDLDIQPWRDTMPVVTIGCWAKLENRVGNANAVLSTDDGGWDRSIYADARGDGTLRWSAFRGYGGLTENTPEARDDEWVFLAAVYNQYDLRVEFYVDGLRHFQYADNIASWPFIEVGRNPSFANDGFEGVIDSVFVFRGRLTEPQIAKIHTQGPSAIPSMQPDLSDNVRYAHDNYSPLPTMEQVVAAPGLLADRYEGLDPIDWRYTTTQPAGVWSGDVYTQENSWSQGLGAFGPDGHRWENDVLHTQFSIPQQSTQNPDGVMWLRASIMLEHDDLAHENGAPLAFWGRWDHQIEVWINGVYAVDREFPNLINEIEGDLGARPSRLHRYLGLTEAGTNAWRPGLNSIAVRLHYGPETDVRRASPVPYFDLGIVRNPFDALPLDGVHTGQGAIDFLEPIRHWAARSCVPTLSFCVMRNDKVEINYSIGHMDKDRTIAAPRDAIFRLASLSKPPAAAAANRLAELASEGHPLGINPANGQAVTLDSPFWEMMFALGVSPSSPLDPAEALLREAITPAHLIRHTSQTAGADRFAIADLYGLDFTGSEQAGWLYSAPLRGSICEPIPEWDICTEPVALISPCYRYSNDGYFLLRQWVDLMTGDFGAFLDDHVVRAADAGGAPFAVAQEDLALRDPLEPWYRSWDWHARHVDRGVQKSLSLRSSAETYCTLLQSRRTFWGGPIPDPLPCGIGMPLPGGWFGGTHTLAGQTLGFESTVSWAILTNESGTGNFDELASVMYGIVSNLNVNDAWGCVADMDDNGEVNLTDFGTFGAAFGSVTGDPNYDADADFDGDGDVDLTDFGTFGAEFGSTGC